MLMYFRRTMKSVLGRLATPIRHVTVARGPGNDLCQWLQLFWCCMQWNAGITVHRLVPLRLRLALRHLVSSSL